MKPVNVLICGKIREIAPLNSELEKYFGWRRDGLVDRIVYSGWLSDLNAHRSLIDDMTAKGVETVFSPEPRFNVYGHVFHQFKQLFYGLGLFNDSDIIFKTRTDKVSTNFPAQESFSYFDLAPAPAESSPFQQRVMVQYTTPFQPYFFGDQVYMGLKTDLMKLISFDVWFDNEHGLLNPEQILHSAPFLTAWPLMRDFFKINPGLIYFEPEKSKRIYDFLLANDFYVGAIYTSIQEMLNSYILGFTDLASRTADFEWPPGIAVQSFIDPNIAPNLGHVFYSVQSASMSTGSSVAINNFLKLPVFVSGSKTLGDVAKQSCWFRKPDTSARRPNLHPNAESLAVALNENFGTEITHMARAPLREKNVLAFYERFPLIQPL